MASRTWFLVVVLAGCGSAEDAMTSPPQAPSLPGLAHHRVPNDERRDELRHPHVFLDFAGVQPGDRVLELGGGDGYTAMHIAQRVGGAGSVLALNPPEWRGFMRPHLAARLRHGPLPGVEFVERPFDHPVLEGEVFDLVVCVLIYHDLLYMDVDRAAMNRRLFSALRPGGHFLIIDHAARDEGDISGGGTLHRIGRQAVIDEVSGAGFALIAESDALRAPADSRTTLAWTSPQPLTDRFILLFQRPE